MNKSDLKFMEKLSDFQINQTLRVVLYKQGKNYFYKAVAEVILNNLLILKNFVILNIFVISNNFF